VVFVEVEVAGLLKVEIGWLKIKLVLLCDIMVMVVERLQEMRAGLWEMGGEKGCVWFKVVRRSVARDHSGISRRRYRFVGAVQGIRVIKWWN
jgi:hypothetical protein